MKNIPLSLLLLTLSLPAQAVPGIFNSKLFGGGFLRNPGDEIEDYQIGSTWGKVPVTLANVLSRGGVYAKTAKVTARYDKLDAEGNFYWGATGFYLGKYRGQHLLGTNHHVVEAIGCDGAPLDFFFQGTGTGVTVHCDHAIGDWVPVDFALITLKDVPEEIEASLAENAMKLQLDEPVRWHQEIMTMGFGIAFNQEPYQANMMVNEDQDCRVYSGDDEFNFLYDPDGINPGAYSAWSFSQGCETSHGDSGSPMVDRNTGKMVGILWTGASPKLPTTRDSAHLASLTPTDPEVWTQLDYAVPSSKIRDYLLNLVEEEDADAREHPEVLESTTPSPGHITPEDRAIIREWLESQEE